MWSVVAGSSTAAWHIWYTPSFIGSTYLSVSSIAYILGMITRRCLNGTAPQYLAAHCAPISATASRQHLRSAASHQLVVPSYRLSYYGHWAFFVAGPTTWNSLPRYLRDLVHTTSVFARLLKTFFYFQSTSVYSVLGAVFGVDAIIISRFTYLLTT